MEDNYKKAADDVSKKAPNTQDLDQPSLSAIFNAFARDAVRDYPRLRGRFTILDVKGRDYHGDIDPAKTCFNGEADFFKFLNKRINENSESNVSKAKRAQKKQLLMIVFNGAMPATLDKHRDIIKTLDHELGHLVVPGAIGGKDNDDVHTNFKECAADAFSCLRDLKRSNGQDKGLIARLSWRRTIRFVRTGNVGHFTLPALQLVDKIKDSIDFSRLTPQQMTRLARDIATASSLSPEQIDKVTKTFAPLHRDHGLPLSTGLLKAVADIVRDETDGLVIRAAHAFISPYIDTGRRFFGQELDTTHPHWQETRQLLAKKNTAHDVTVPVNIMANIPRRKAGKNPALKK